MKRNTYASKMFKKMRQAMKRWQRQQEKRIKRLFFSDLPSYKKTKEKAKERLSWIRYYYFLKRNGSPAPSKRPVGDSESILRLSNIGSKDMIHQRA